MPSPMHVCPKEGPTEADSEGKVSLTKGAYKAARWLEGAWEKGRGAGRVGVRPTPWGLVPALVPGSCLAALLQNLAPKCTNI